MITRITAPTRRRFTVAEYHRMGETGILRPDERVELIDGDVVQMPPIGDWHQESVDRATELFVQRFADVARVRIQGPTTLDDYSEPQPDVMLLRRRPGFYASGHPAPSDVLLAIEISDTSARYDRRVKARLYARHSIPEMWQADRHEDAVIVYREPGADGYGLVQTFRRGERLAALAFPDHAIAVTDILGEAP